MNRLLPRFITRAYRKEPISAFILTIGVVNAIIGGFGERWSLLTLGLLVGTSAIALRWWQSYQYRPISQRQTTTRYLNPSQASPPRPLPPLSKMQGGSRR
jgi:hypothetical protein